MRLQDVGDQVGIPGEAGCPRAALAPQAGPFLRLGLCLQDAHRLRAAFFPVLKMPPDEGRLVSPGLCAPLLVFLPHYTHVLNVVTRALVLCTGSGFSAPCSGQWVRACVLVLVPGPCKARWPRRSRKTWRGTAPE